MPTGDHGDHEDSGPPAAPIATVVVTLPADLDYASATEINTQLAAAFTPTTRTVIADLSGTAFCDSSGLRELVLARKLANTTHTELRLVIPPDHTRLIKSSPSPA